MVERYFEQIGTCRKVTRKALGEQLFEAVEQLDVHLPWICPFQICNTVILLCDIHALLQ